MRSAAVVGVVFAVVGCGKPDAASKAKGSAAQNAVAATLATVQIRDFLNVTVTTEPYAEVYFSPTPGAASPLRVTSDAEGKAKTEISRMKGTGSLLVIVDTSDKRTGKHTFPFSIGEPESIVFADPTPRTDTFAVVNCSGHLMEPGESTQMCGTYINLADDGSVGFAVVSNTAKQLVIGDATFDARDGQISARVELVPKIVALDLFAAMREYPVELPATLHTANGSRTGTLSIGRGAVTTLLSKIRTGPLAFAGSAPAPAKPASLVLIGDLTEALGNTEVLVRDLDLVGIVSSSFREASACQYVATDGTGAKKSVARRMLDYAATIYDRRTGKKLGTKSWRAKTPGCDRWVKMDAGTNFEEPDTELLISWAKSFVAG
ncbi:MAG: hypothetical protein ACKV2T_07655 [Kofleriaceae bacterium]